MKKYEETQMDNMIFKTLSEKLNYGWDLSFSKDVVKILMEGIAKYLGEVKDKNKVKALKIVDNKGTFYMAGFVEYHETEDGKGSFSLTYTFEPDDIKKEWDSVESKDAMVRNIFADIGYSNYGIAFKSTEGISYINPIMCAIADCIKEYLRANVQLDPGIELENYFTASAELEGDKVYCKIIPGEILKQHVKDDAELEVVA
jgi:hypothetical protein